SARVPDPADGMTEGLLFGTRRKPSVQAPGRGQETRVQQRTAGQRRQAGRLPYGCAGRGRLAQLDGPVRPPRKRSSTSERMAGRWPEPSLEAPLPFPLPLTAGSSGSAGASGGGAGSGAGGAAAGNVSEPKTSLNSLSLTGRAVPR